MMNLYGLTSVKHIFALFNDVYDICQFDYQSESEIRDFNNYMWDILY